MTATTSRTIILDRRVSVLRFARALGESSPPDGEYMLRGGICWPIIVEPSPLRMEGFALLGGCHLATGSVWILSQRPFVCVDNVQDSRGSIQFEGLASWFVGQWGAYYADTYAWKQPWETNRRYLVQVLRSPFIEPKPHLLELEWDDDDDARGIIFEAEAAGRLKYPADSPMHNELRQFTVAKPEDRDRFPAVHALTCCLFALVSARKKDTRT